MYCRYCGNSISDEGREYFCDYMCETCRNADRFKKVWPNRFCPTCGTQLSPKTALDGKRYWGIYCDSCKATRKPKARPARELSKTQRMIRNAQARKWQERNAGKVKAAQLARYYSEQNIVLYECPCDVKKKENHHHDYSRPFEVIRLCRRCHMAWHKKLREMQKQSA